MVDARSTKSTQTKVKCLVWDLDNTLWSGTLLEGDQVKLKPSCVDLIKLLDSRGILNSIASRNVAEDARKKLAEFGIDHFFLCPQIGWNEKSTSISLIAETLNIGLDTIAFVDDQIFEREEVQHEHPQVRCFDADEIDSIHSLPEFSSTYSTVESNNRRQMYIDEETRQEKEKAHDGSTESFLSTLELKVSIKTATANHLARASELTERTNQFNTTGISYSEQDLLEMMKSKDYRVYVVELQDKYGSYGTIGLSVIHTTEDIWTIKLLLMSCRVISRNIGTVFISYLLRQALKNGKRLQAEMVHNSRNRMMQLAYKFSGFSKISVKDHTHTLEHHLRSIPEYPEYVSVEDLYEYD